MPVDTKAIANSTDRIQPNSVDIVYYKEDPIQVHVHRFSRRGLNDVRAEMYEKVVAHNVWRAATLRKRAAAQEKKALTVAA